MRSAELLARPRALNTRPWLEGVLAELRYDRSVIDNPPYKANSLELSVMMVEGVCEWYTEAAKNKDGKSHVKVYPTMIDGREIPNSFVLSWEDYPLGASPSSYSTDLIVRVDGVRPATP